MKLSTVVFLIFLSVAQIAPAQSMDPSAACDQSTVDSSGSQLPVPAAAPVPSTTFHTKPIIQPVLGAHSAPARERSGVEGSPRATEPGSGAEPRSGPFFKTVGHDVTGFFAPDTAKILGTFALAGVAVMHWDNASVEDTSERLSKSAYKIGNIGGSLYVQAGAGIATYAIGRATGKPQLASLGGDLVRAQILSQLFVQGAKFAVGRQRPDGSNSMSFPSGHSASAFATATVVQEHFGWKAGIPAYTFAGFVGASRLAAGKHYLSDVVIGAGIGIAAGRTVTLRFGGENFALGAAPTQGGAMVTFTRR
jgi:membrane-associated phospholipid phosphatase